MTVSIDGTDIGQIVEIASIVGSIVAALVIALIVYLMVRPPRHVRAQRRAERRGEIRPGTDAAEAEELRLVVDRMEARLKVLERALAEQSERPALGGRDEPSNTVFMPAAEGRDRGRKE